MRRKSLKWRTADAADGPEGYGVTRRSALRRLLMAGSVLPLVTLAGEEALAGASKVRSDAVVYRIVTFQVLPESMERFLAIYDKCCSH